VFSYDVTSDGVQSMQTPVFLNIIFSRSFISCGAYVADFTTALGKERSFM